MGPKGMFLAVNSMFGLEVVKFLDVKVENRPARVPTWDPDVPAGPGPPAAGTPGDPL